MMTTSNLEDLIELFEKLDNDEITLDDISVYNELIEPVQDAIDLLEKVNDMASGLRDMAEDLHYKFDLS